MLSVKDVVVRFGGVVALDGPTFEVAAGEICGLIGPNGAGKTTLFNCVSRLDDPTRARSRSTARTCSRARRTRSPPLGIARTFQNLGLVPSLTVRENVMLGAHHAGSGSFLADGAAAARPRAARSASCASRPTTHARAARARRRRRPPGRRPAVRHAQAHRARPRAGREPQLLLLDEPASGLTHGEVDELGRPAARAARRARPDDPARRAPHGRWSCGSPTRSSCSTSAARSPTARRPRSSEDPQVIEAYLGTPRVSLLEVEGLDAGYGPVHASLHGSPSRSTRARSSRSSAPTAPARRPRCARSPAWSRAKRQRSRFDGSELIGRAPEQIVRRGRRPRARGPRHVRRPDRRGEPAARRLRRARTTARSRDDIERCFGYFPRLEERRAQHGGQPQRRRAADARDRPRR